MGSFLWRSRRLLLHSVSAMGIIFLLCSSLDFTCSRVPELETSLPRSLVDTIYFVIDWLSLDRTFGSRIWFFTVADRCFNTAYFFSPHASLHSDSLSNCLAAKQKMAPAKAYKLFSFGRIDDLGRNVLAQYFQLELGIPDVVGSMATGSVG